MSDGLSPDGDREAVIQRVLSLYTVGVTRYAMKAGNVFGADRRERNGALTVDSW